MVNTLFQQFSGLPNNQGNFAFGDIHGIDNLMNRHTPECFNLLGMYFPEMKAVCQYIHAGEVIGEGISDCTVKIEDKYRLLFGSHARGK
jgi:hypothetical protein